MKNIVISILLLGTVGMTSAAVHVSPQGDDEADGSVGNPVRSLAKARDFALRQSDRTVVLASGIYELERPLLLKDSDRGLVFTAAPGAKPVVSAGRQVRDWTVDAKGWWHARFPAGTKFSQFYVNGQRRSRPFLPRQGYYFIAHEAPKGAEGFQQFYAEKGVFDPSWKLDDVEVCIFNNWNLARLPAKSYEVATGLVTLNAPFKPKACYYSLVPENWYRLDNVRAALGEPGDWYLDKGGDLVYVPWPGEDSKTAVCVASYLDAAVRIVGARDITFKGITFAHVDWSMPENGYHHAQAAATLPGAVDVEYSSNILLERCAVIHSGAYAVSFGRGAQECAALDCEFVDLGAGGVKIGCEWADGKDPRNFGKGCVVENCLIRGGGRVDPAGVGVFIGHGFGCRISHNTICDLHYSGISLGWNWGFAETAHDNIIEWNHIHTIGKRVLSDMGGIYSLGRQRGSVERFNHIHDITRARYGAFGIYFDSGSSLITVTNNVVHDVEDCNLYLQTLSASNVVENNIFACGTKYQLQIPARDAASSPTRFARNLLWWDEGAFFMSVPDEKTLAMAGNIYWNVGDGVAPQKEVRGFTRADPCFVDPGRRDFRFKDETTAKSIGFVPFSVAEAGRRGKAVLTANLPAIPDVYFPAPEKPVRPCREDFESVEAGCAWPGWQCMPDNPSRYARTTAETAAQGRRSLEVTDTQADWMPHFCDWPNRRKGMIVASFWMRLGAGAKLAFEVRDREGWCAAPGPFVAVGAQRWLVGREGRKLLQIPENEWIKVELEFEIGKTRTEHVYTVRVTLPGESAPHVFEKLPVHRKFQSVGWVGFLSLGAVGSKYWIDDFSLSE